ncbi:hypothetical protein PCANC_03825 [Puccinia coronata f. sp. avenae]|uniref:Uncharacterized protein n=1 Tax=Puccinia coronata f. sp. avenae TaxID=200324 RepID=A0A2N5VKX0_9BASI|nr:hypothetical protein PCANC_03825 [Puccinia coronata f. sp. avenae]PLW50639.1 hypothetical protein PCASD_00678 [Puccinia coronata f. sp. avenae]
MAGLHQSSRGVSTPLNDRYKPAINGSMHPPQWPNGHQGQRMLPMTTHLYQPLKGVCIPLDGRSHQDRCHTRGYLPQVPGYPPGSSLAGAVVGAGAQMS